MARGVGSPLAVSHWDQEPAAQQLTDSSETAVELLFLAERRERLPEARPRGESAEQLEILRAELAGAGERPGPRSGIDLPAAVLGVQLSAHPNSRLEHQSGPEQRL